MTVLFIALIGTLILLILVDIIEEKDKLIRSLEHQKSLVENDLRWEKINVNNLNKVKNEYWDQLSNIKDIKMATIRDLVEQLENKVGKLESLERDFDKYEKLEASVCCNTEEKQKELYKKIEDKYDELREFINLVIDTHEDVEDIRSKWWNAGPKVTEEEEDGN